MVSWWFLLLHSQVCRLGTASSPDLNTDTQSKYGRNFAAEVPRRRRAPGSGPCGGYVKTLFRLCLQARNTPLQYAGAPRGCATWRRGCPAKTWRPSSRRLSPAYRSPERPVPLDERYFAFCVAARKAENASSRSPLSAMEMRYTVASSRSRLLSSGPSRGWLECLLRRFLNGSLRVLGRMR